MLFTVQINLVVVVVVGKGGGPQGYVGHLTSIAFSALGNLTKNLGPRVETFALCVQEFYQVTSSHVNNGKNPPKAKPLSEILLEAHKK